MAWYNWIISILLFIVVPVSVICWRKTAAVAIVKGKYDKKKFIIASISQTLFYWFLGAFHLCAIFNVLVWTFIFGGISLIIIFYNLANVFINRAGAKTLNKLGLLQDFIVGLIITVYLIYIIPEGFEELQTIVTAIVAAVYGGLLTLTGVAWTIKHNKDILKKESIERIKPFLAIDTSLELIDYKHIRQIVFATNFEDIKIGSDNTYYLGRPIFRNVGDNVCVLDYIRINNKKYRLISPYTILKGQQFYLTTNNIIRSIGLKDEKLKEISLGIYDIAYNLYEFKLVFDVVATSTPENYIEFEGVPEKMVVRQQNGLILYKSIKIKYIDCSSESIIDDKQIVEDRTINEMKTEFKESYKVDFDKGDNK